MYSKKGQSAMEYLMTYGWAILIILIAVGALFYLGVFSPSVPNTCMFSAPFSCIGGDILIQDSTNFITFKVAVGAGSGGTNTGITGITVDGNPMNLVVGVPVLGACGTTVGFLNWASGTQKTITCYTAETEGSKISGTVDFSYDGEAGMHTTSGTFSGSVEA